MSPFQGRISEGVLSISIQFFGESPDKLFSSFRSQIMSLRENRLRKLLAAIAVASASCFVSLSAFALIDSSSTTPSYSGKPNESQKALAQATPGEQTTPTPGPISPSLEPSPAPVAPTPSPTPAVTPRPTVTPTPSLPLRPTPTPTPTPSLPLRPTPTPTTGTVPGFSPLERGSWACLNNPNPACR